jgi:hypothetical protein
MIVRRFKKYNVINVIDFLICLLFSTAWHYVALFQEFVDMQVNCRPSVFRIYNIHQMETSLPRFVGLLILSLCHIPIGVDE